MKLPPLHAHPDLAAVRALLAAAGLPTADLAAASLADFWGCRAGEDLAGAIGLEPYGAVALLHSLAVAPPGKAGAWVPRCWPTPNERPACGACRSSTC